MTAMTKRRIFTAFSGMLLAFALTACAGREEESAAQQQEAPETGEPARVEESAALKDTEVSAEQLPYDSVFPQHEPYGAGIGTMPGRVVWVYDADAVRWDGSGYWWRTENFDESAVQSMVNDGIASLGGKGTAKEGWVALFEAHNMSWGRGSAGYAAGEKIAIKANITVYDVSRLFPDYMVKMCTEGILPSVDKGKHASKRDNSGIFCVILHRCTSSTPLSSVLKLPEFSPLEVAESGRRKFYALQGA